MQCLRKKFPPHNPFATYRRAFALSIFGVVMLEVSEFEAFLVFEYLFPRLLLPFIDMKVDEIEISKDLCTLN